MITGHKAHFLQRCRERGYSLEEVAGCIVQQDGDMWTIDVEHPTYPRYKKTASSVAGRNSAAEPSTIYICDD